MSSYLRISDLTAIVFSAFLVFFFSSTSHALDIASVTPSTGLPGSGIVITGTDFPQAAKAALYGGPATILGSYTDGAIDRGMTVGTYMYGVAGEFFQIIDIREPTNPHLAGSCWANSSMRAFAVDPEGGAYGCGVGSKYVGTEDVGYCEVVNVSDPGNPVVVGGCELPEPAFDVAVAGTYAFVADGWGGLQVVDFSDPANPHVVWEYDISDFGPATALTLVDNDLYVACNETIYRFFVSNPASPQYMGGCWLGWCEAFPEDICYDLGFANDVAVYRTESPYAQYLCLAYSEGLMIIDMTDGLPGDLTAAEYNSFYMPQAPNTIAVVDGLAYLGSGAEGVKVVDIRDRYQLCIVGGCDTPGAAYDVILAGSIPLVADGGSGLQMLAPWRPLEGLAYLDATTLAAVVPADQPPGLWNLWVADPSVEWYTASRFLEGAFTVTSPPNPVDVNPASGPSGSSITVAGEDFMPGAQIALDAGGGNIYTVGACPTPGNQHDSARAVSVAGTHAYVANGTTFKVIDISIPSAPSVVGGCDATAQGLAARGVFAYTVGYPKVFEVIDLRDLSAPFVIGNCETAGWPRAVAISGDYAYVADGSSGLTAIDIKDPRNPGKRWTCDTWGTASDVAVAGDYAYVASGEYGLYVIDLNVPDDPVFRYRLDTPGEALGIAVSGGRAYVADGPSGIQAVDVSEPWSPTLLGSCDTPGYAGAVAVRGNYAYVADDANVTSGSSGVQVIDVNPASETYLTIVGHADTPGAAKKIALQGINAYVADYEFGLQVLGLFGSQPSTTFVDEETLTTEIASWLSPGVFDLYVANPDGGLGILKNAFSVSSGCDLACFSAAYGSRDGDDRYNLTSDFDGDGDVDGKDLAGFAGGFQL